MKLWLDDVRDPTFWGRKGWTWCKTPTEAKALMENHEVTDASLDHDLGAELKPGFDPKGKPHNMAGNIHFPNGHDPEGSGHNFCLWMEKHDLWPTRTCNVHSAAEKGVARMLPVIREKFPHASWVHINGRPREEQFR